MVPPGYLAIIPAMRSLVEKLCAKPLRVWLVGACLLFLPGARALAQRPPLPTPTPSENDEERERTEKQMAKKANLQRHRELKRDTDQLLKLATELKESVDKSNENMLSLDVIKKAEEIEKLAHSVKEKMKGN